MADDPRRASGGRGRQKSLSAELWVPTNVFSAVQVSRRPQRGRKVLLAGYTGGFLTSSGRTDAVGAPDAEPELPLGPRGLANRQERRPGVKHIA